jgi:hypothetical protein
MTAFSPLVPEASNGRVGVFNAAGAAGLKGPARRVQPYVGPLHQERGLAQVVVFEKDHVIAQTLGLDGLDHLPDEILAGSVVGMGFAGENKLHRPLLVQQERLQAGQVA